MTRWADEIRESDPESDAMTPEDVENLGTPDDQVDVAVDVSAFVANKVAALEAHRTQYGTTERFLSIPDERRRQVLSVEYFVLARGRPDTVLDDLFTGVA